MRSRVLLSIDGGGLRDISLVAESEKECESVMKTYRKFETEILDFIRALKAKASTEKVICEG